MSRPLRIHLPKGWFHVTARGNERRLLFEDDADRRHFLGLLAELPTRFGLSLLAYVLMNNHYHLLLVTSHRPLSQAMQWLNVSYTVWFNRRHRRVGHLLQGRFKAVVVDPEGWSLRLSRYVHLNPVRTAGMGLDKRRQQRSRAGVEKRAAAEWIRERVRVLRGYRWSSYRGLIGLEEPPPWLGCGTVLGLIGGRAGKRQRAAYRQYVEQAVREGLEESPWEELAGGLALGGAEFVNRIRKLACGKGREQPSVRALQERALFEEVVEVVEAMKGEKWEAFRDRYGDWGRDVALYLGRNRCGMTLRELGAVAGGMDYGSVSVAVRRMGRQRRENDRVRTLIEKADDKLSNVQT